LQEEKLIRIRQLKAGYVISIVQSTTAIPNKLHETLKLPNIHLALYILMEKAAMLKTCCIVRKFWQNSEEEVLGQ